MCVCVCVCVSRLEIEGGTELKEIILISFSVCVLVCVFVSLCK